MLGGEWPAHGDQKGIYLTVILIKYTRVTLLLLADPFVMLLGCTAENNEQKEL